MWKLDSHDVILAEGLAAESYLDTGNRAGFFNNGGSYLEAHPDFKPKHWAETCVPLVFEGAILQGGEVKATRARAGARLLPPADLRALVAAGRAHWNHYFATSKRVAFVLPPDQYADRIALPGIHPGPHRMRER